MFLSRIMRGVPKYRTPKPKKQTRKFSHTRMLKPAENLIQCAKCSSVHHVSRICLTCYEDIRVATNEIKRQMINYNPYLGERPKPVNNTGEKHENAS